MRVLEAGAAGPGGHVATRRVASAVAVVEASHALRETRRAVRGRAATITFLEARDARGRGEVADGRRPTTIARGSTWRLTGVGRGKTRLVATVTAERARHARPLDASRGRPPAMVVPCAFGAAVSLTADARARGAAERADLVGGRAPARAIAAPQQQPRGERVHGQGAADAPRAERACQLARVPYQRQNPGENTRAGLSGSLPGTERGGGAAATAT